METTILTVTLKKLTKSGNVSKSITETHIAKDALDRYVEMMTRNYFKPNEKIIIETKEVDIIEIIEESDIDTSNWWIPDVYESSFYTTNGWEHLFFKEIKNLRYE